jgi:stalled ribosome rescue protein Dom34
MATRHVAVWIDHNEARIFHLTPESFEEETVDSPRAHTKLHRHAGSTTSGHAGEDQHYYHKVAEHLAGAEEILVVGPANAKNELVKHIDSHDRSLKSRVVGVETMDHPSDAQIAAHARKYFKRVDRMIG